MPGIEHSQEEDTPFSGELRSSSGFQSLEEILLGVAERQSTRCLLNSFSSDSPALSFDLCRDCLLADSDGHFVGLGQPLLPDLLGERLFGREPGGDPTR